MMNEAKNVDTERKLMVIPFCRKSKHNICFRECVKLIKIAEETGCRISFTAGGSKGDTDSLLSLLKLGIIPGTSVVMSLSGGNVEEAYRQAMTVLEGEAA